MLPICRNIRTNKTGACIRLTVKCGGRSVFCDHCALKMVTYRPVWQLCLILSAGLNGCCSGASCLKRFGFASYTSENISIPLSKSKVPLTYLEFYHRSRSSIFSFRLGPSKRRCSFCRAVILCATDPRASLFAWRDRRVRSSRRRRSGISRGRDQMFRCCPGKARRVWDGGVGYPIF